jgi:hypothetical protein
MGKVSACCMVLCSLFVSVAAAAAVRDTLPGPHDTLSKVTVTGYIDDGSEKNALRLQSRSGMIIEIISAENVAQSSDLSVADITRRVNGLSVTTDHSGLSDRTIIRGMDPKYNYTLVDGIKVPSPGDRSRYVPLAIFPADIVQRLEVYKSLTPEMEGDAIGGVVNLVLRNAPNEPLFKIRLAGGYNQAFIDRSYLSFDSRVVQKQSPYQRYGPDHAAAGSDFSRANLYFATKQPAPDLLGGLTWGQRYFHKKLGVLIAGDFQNIKRGSSNYFIPQNNEPQLNNAPGLTDFYLDQYSTTIIRKGLHVKLDLTINPKNSIDLYQSYSNQEDIESRHRVDTSLTQGRSEPGTGRITLSDRSRLHFQDLYNTSLRGTHRLNSNWSLKWTAAYAIATGLYPDWSELSAGTALIQQSNGSIAPSPLLLDPLTRVWLRNREQDLSESVYSDYHTTIKGRDLTFSAGGLYRAKDRNNFYNSYTFQPAITGSYGQPFIDIYHAVWTNNNGPQDPFGAVANSNTYTAHEYITAAHAALSLKGRKMEWMAGLRYENTRQQFVSSVDPAVSYGKEGSIQYGDLLPSVQVKFRLRQAQQIRASWYESISRPALYDVTFYAVTYEDYLEAGNPFLQRARANNVDLRYEWYPGGLDFLQLGMFYKHITNAYERTLLNAGDELYPLPSQGLPYTPAGELTAQMRNVSEADDYGFEVAAARYIGKMGVQAGYTYIYSQITLPSKFKTRQDPANPSSDLITISKNETRPLQGQSPHLASLSLIYRDDHKGWRGRLTTIYTGRRIYSSSGWYGLDYWQRGSTVLDASLEKRLGRHVKIYLKANNLFNTVTTVDLLTHNPEFASRFIPGQQSEGRITVMRQVDKASYYAGLEWVLP